MYRKTISRSAVLGCALLGVCALMSDAGQIDPPAGPVGSTMVSLAEIDANVRAAQGGSCAMPCGLPILTHPTEIGMSYSPISVGPVQGDDFVGGVADLSRVLDFKMTASSGSSSGGGFSLSDITVVKEMDSASPKLAYACCSGEHFSEVVLQCRRAGGTPVPYLEIKMSNVLVSSYQLGAVGSHESTDSVPTETLSLNFEEIKVTYGLTGENTTATQSGGVTFNPGGPGGPGGPQ